MSFDVAVVGRGMVGSAAARHLAEAGHSVALIGPGEPTDRRLSRGPFSSHPDEGRITRVAGRSGIWSEVAARSVARYPDIAERSGVEFHHPRGLAVVSDDASGWIERGQAAGSDARLVSSDWLEETTGIHVGNGKPILYEGAPAGWINPRRLVEAQTQLTAAAGGEVVDEAVSNLSPGAAGFEIGGPWGSVTARRVLLATGAFGSELLGGRSLDLIRRPRTILMAEMADDTAIPSLILDGAPDNRLDEIYWVPPVMYPDGRLCLKIGGEVIDLPGVEQAELVEWFHGNGSRDEGDALENCLRALLPNVEFVSFKTAPCVITATPTDQPYIGWIEDDMAVAIGGNGAAAKSSDELGRLAATLFDRDGWTDTIDATEFTPRFR